MPTKKCDCRSTTVNDTYFSNDEDQDGSTFKIRMLTPSKYRQASYQKKIHGNTNPDRRKLDDSLKEPYREDEHRDGRTGSIFKDDDRDSQQNYSKEQDPRELARTNDPVHNQPRPYYNSRTNPKPLDEQNDYDDVDRKNTARRQNQTDVNQTNVISPSTINAEQYATPYLGRYRVKKGDFHFKRLPSVNDYDRRSNYEEIEVTFNGILRSTHADTEPFPPSRKATLNEVDLSQDERNTSYIFQSAQQQLARDDESDEFECSWFGRQATPTPAAENKKIDRRNTTDESSRRPLADSRQKHGDKSQGKPISNITTTQQLTSHNASTFNTKQSEQSGYMSNGTENGYVNGKVGKMYTGYDNPKDVRENSNRDTNGYFDRDYDQHRSSAAYPYEKPDPRKGIQNITQITSMFRDDDRRNRKGTGQSNE
jgi:hypothetical protein